MKYQQLIDSLISELKKPKKLTNKEKSLLLANALFACTLSGFSIFLGKQQTLRLCNENLHCSSEEAWIFFIPNGISHSLVTIFTSSQLFSAIQKTLSEKNHTLYLTNKNGRKTSIQLTLSMLAGLIAAIPIMLSTRDPIGSKLAFIANFIIASYSFYSIAQNLAASSSNVKPHVQLFLQTLKSYELRNNPNVSHKNVPRWVKISSSILLPLFYNGSFCINNILLLNNPNNDLGALHLILPENKNDRLIASIFLGTTFTVPWFILAGIFGHRLPDTLLQQFYLNPFAKVNPHLNMFLQILQGLISLCSFALPVKFFIDVQEELFDSCEDFCTFLIVLVALSGSLFSLLPNLKVAELIIIFWNLFLSSNEKNYEETFEIMNTRELAAQFKDIQVALPACDVDEISEGLNQQLSTMTERYSLLQYRQSEQQEHTYLLENLNANPNHKNNRI